MKLHFGLLVVALSAIGCGTDELDTGEAEQALRGVCPDPQECTLSNGGGVYTQELGNAHIGSNDLMLTHFVNVSGGGVIVEGREFDAANNVYFKQTSQALQARYPAGGNVYTVFGVYESQTMPQFRLQRLNGTTFNVTAGQLVDLELIVPIRPDVWTITFKAGQNHGDDAGGGRRVDQLLGGPGNLSGTLYAYDMFWNTGSTRAANPEPYCHLAKKLITNPPAPLSDPVVFQQGIVVNAVNAVTATNMNSYVTLSCLHGAIATAHWWGYSYRGTDDQTDMFEAAMHMKRASYCGDDSFYTRRNVLIAILDDVNNLTDALTPFAFEASWGRAYLNGPIRATCLNGNNRRRQHANYPPDPMVGSEFNGWCGTVQLPDCADDASGFGHLASQKTQ